MADFNYTYRTESGSKYAYTDGWIGLNGGTKINTVIAISVVDKDGQDTYIDKSKDKNSYSYDIRVYGEGSKPVTYSDIFLDGPGWYETPSNGEFLWKVGPEYETFNYGGIDCGFNIDTGIDNYAGGGMVTINIYKNGEKIVSLDLVYQWSGGSSTIVPRPEPVHEGGLTFTLYKGNLTTPDKKTIPLSDTEFLNAMGNHFGGDKHIGFGIWKNEPIDNPDYIDGSTHRYTNALYYFGFGVPDGLYNIEDRAFSLEYNYYIGGSGMPNMASNFDEIGVSYDGTFTFLGYHSNDFRYIVGFSSPITFSLSESKINQAISGLNDDTLLDIGVCVNDVYNPYIPVGEYNDPYFNNIHSVLDSEDKWAKIVGGDMSNNHATWSTIKVGDIKKGVGDGVNMNIRIG